MNHHPDFLSMLFERAVQHPDRPAIVFLDEQRSETTLTYGSLWQKSLEIANALTDHDATNPTVNCENTPYRRALLLFPPGIDFFPAFFGCQLARWIPVPTNYPKPHREMPRLNSCARDCSPSLILSNRRTLDTLDRTKLDPAADVPAIAVDQLPQATAFDGQNRLTGNRFADQSSASLKAIDPKSTAFLQYTSGSTSAPKGVVVSHQNLMANLEAIRVGFGLGWAETSGQSVTTSVFWLPHFHDMGLIGGVLAPLYVGFRTVLMSPQAFVRRPVLWLRAVQQYRAVVTGAPNFAFELCTDRIPPEQAQTLDLSSLRVLFCGAEPIRANALRAFEARFASAGFDGNSFYPCYGLAEATLLASGGQGPGQVKVLSIDRQSLQQGTIRLTQSQSNNTTSLVSCGKAALETEIAIADPESRIRLNELQVGEVWLRGPSVSAGYYRMAEDQEERFSATLRTKRAGRFFWSKVKNTTDDLDPKPAFFRTGDLGFMHEGNLYITGRIKELIIVRGRNYFPQDIEATTQASGLKPCGRAAAVPIDGPRGESLGVAVEVHRRTSTDLFPSMIRTLRRRIIDEHDIDPRELIFVATGSIPVTTSGKLRRNAARELFAASYCDTLYRWCRNNAAESPPINLPVLPDVPTEQDFESIREMVGQWMTQWLVVRAGIPAAQIDLETRFEDYGLDSLMAIELVGDLEDACDVELTPTVAMQNPTILQMSTLVATMHCDKDTKVGEELDEVVSAARD
jgi:acyl-CoA synthetase (AMP-forming)/AMP-acid ligase II/acyl carrier protein